MFSWFESEEKKIQRIINEYNNSENAKNLILEIFGRSGGSDLVDNEEYEDASMVINYSCKYDSHTKRVYQYKVQIKYDNELIEVFNRSKVGDGPVNVKTFKIGSWIYHLYKIKNKLLTAEETYVPNVDLPNEEKNRLDEVE